MASRRLDQCHAGSNVPLALRVQRPSCVGQPGSHSRQFIGDGPHGMDYKRCLLKTSPLSMFNLIAACEHNRSLQAVLFACVSLPSVVGDSGLF